MTIGLKDDIRNDRLDLITQYIDAGAGPGTIKVYDGTRPAKGAAITTETLLVTGTFSDPSAPAATGGVLTFNAITGGNAVADGTATWARVEDSDGTFIMDMSVGLVGSGADLILNTTALVTGGPVAFTAATITAGNA